MVSACLSSILILLTPAALARRSKLLPRDYFPTNYLNVCATSCTVASNDHILCTVDCPPIIGFIGTGTAQPTGGVAPISNFSLPTATTTQYITTIPAYCLPGGPGAPIPNVPTVSLAQASLIPTAPPPNINLAPAVIPALQSIIPAIVLQPTGAVANQTATAAVSTTSPTMGAPPVMTTSPPAPAAGMSSEATKQILTEKVVGGVLLSVMVLKMVGVF